MLDINLLTKILVVLGGAGSASFLVIGDVKQFSNTKRKWISKIGNSETAVIEFDSKDSQSKSELQGKWRFLNTKSNSSKSLTGDGFYEVTIQNEAVVDKYYEEKELGKLIKILHCGGSNDSSYKKTNWKIGLKEMKCKDVTKEWLYGVALGETKGLGFYIKRKVFENSIEGIIQKSEWWWLNKEKEDRRIDNGFKEEIERSIQDIEVLGDRTSWAGENQVKLCSSLKGAMSSNEGNCIAYGKMIERELVEEYSKECKEVNGRGGLCGLKIIDVSTYKLTKNGNDQTWNSEFTPEITWKLSQ